LLILLKSHDILTSTEQGINNATTLLHEVGQQTTPLAVDIREALDEMLTRLGTETRSDI
jgi:hypothetical protein